MRGPSIDCEVARDVMGWDWREGKDRGWYKYNRELAASEDWSPTTEMGDAWQVHKKACNEAFCTQRKYLKVLHNEVNERLGFDLKWYNVLSALWPRDICRAALKVAKKKHLREVREERKRRGY